MMDQGRKVFLILLLFIFILHSKSEDSQYEVLYSTDNAGARGIFSWITSTELGRTKNGWQMIAGVEPGTRAYQTCDVNIFNAFNWLQLPYINTKQGNIIHIDVKFSMIDCAQKENSKESCKNTLDVLYLESEGDTLQSTEYGDFHELGQLEANGMFTEPDPGATPLIKFKRFWFSPQLKQTPRGIYVAFRDTGSCATIHKVDVHYFVCPSFTGSLSSFRETPSGPHFIEVQGTCVDNADSKFHPQMACGSNGDWTKENLVTGCACRAGYQPDTLRKNCYPCQKGYYKNEDGPGSCKLCPLHSSSIEDRGGGRTKCVCDPGYYRAEHEASFIPCAKKPSKPREVNFTVSGTDVALTWRPPLDRGGRPDVWYQVVCSQCSNKIVYSTSPDHISDLGISLHRLEANSQYTMRIYSMSAVTTLTNAAYSEVFVQTGTRNTIDGLSAEWVLDTGVVRVSWNPPTTALYQTDGQAAFNKFSYELHVWRSEKIYAIFNTDMNYHNLRDLSPGSYTFQVVVHNDHSIASDQRVFIVTSKDVFISGITPKKLGVTVALISAMALLLLVVLLLAVWCYKRRTYKWTNASHLLDVTQAEVGGLKLPCGQAFVDPGYYDDIRHILGEFTRELQIAQIEFVDETGGPGLPDVVKGVIHYSDYEKPLAMIKKIRENATNAECKCFCMEAAIAGQFNHPNILMLHGVALQGSDMYMCLEYTARGPLDRMLRDHPLAYTPLQLVHLLRGISCGMHYLSDLGYIHKVLNAENILLSTASVCKIAGFDTRVALEFEESIGGSALFYALVPWGSPEVASLRKYSSASDVWSFGVLAWEVTALGERPFWDWDPEEILKTVESGYRLPPPLGCPQVVYDLMNKCWQQERNHRPLFCQIREELEQFIRTPTTLEQLAYAKNIAAGTLKSSTMGSCFSGTSNIKLLSPSNGSLTPQQHRSMAVSDWLKTLKLDQYTQAFAHADFSTVDDVLSLDARMLEALGVSSGKHRRKLLAAIDSLRGSYMTVKHVSMMNDSPVHVLI